ncbi:MAG: hypothetical protein JWP12_2469 [Bacteroidetes bacterium]|nr:hypothetical protein [Bacteroidota bacterium]
MNIPSPHLDDFKSGRQIEKIQVWLLWAATAFAVLSFIIANDHIQQLIDTNGLKDFGEYAKKVFDVMVSAIAVLYAILDFIVMRYFDAGGKKKRNDLLDNSLGSNLNGIKSSGYFSNSNLPDGIYKLGVNAFENSYFTATIVSNMLLKRWLTTGALVIAILLSVFSGSLGVFNTLIQLSITGIIFQKTIKLQWYYFKMNQINQDFKTLFNSLLNAPAGFANDAEILRNVLNYECGHAWGGVFNDQDIYDKLNPKMSQDWETIKNNYKIR